MENELIRKGPDSIEENLHNLIIKLLSDATHPYTLITIFLYSYPSPAARHLPPFYYKLTIFFKLRLLHCTKENFPTVYNEYSQ